MRRVHDYVFLCVCCVALVYVVHVLCVVLDWCCLISVVAGPNETEIYGVFVLTPVSGRRPTSDARARA